MGMVPPFLDNPHEPQPPPPDSAGLGSYLPMALIILALLLWFSVLLSQILSERSQLHATFESQEEAMQQASQMRRTLDALAEGVTRLSANGNQNAKTFLEQMASRGIVINTPEPSNLKPQPKAPEPAPESATAPAAGR